MSILTLSPSEEPKYNWLFIEGKWYRVESLGRK